MSFLSDDMVLTLRFGKPVATAGSAAGHPVRFDVAGRVGSRAATHLSVRPAIPPSLFSRTARGVVTVHDRRAAAIGSRAHRDNVCVMRPQITRVAAFGVSWHPLPQIGASTVSPRRVAIHP
jgi:hypothetical protein